LRNKVVDLSIPLLAYSYISNIHDSEVGLYSHSSK